MSSSKKDISETPSVAATYVEEFQKTQEEAPASDLIDKKMNDLLADSEKYYRELTNNIVDITETNLNKQIDEKKELQERLVKFVVKLLSFQFIILVIMIFGNEFFSLNIPTSVFKFYIVSVFAETFAGMVSMIKFAFNNTQEMKLISVLNTIVTNFQKFKK